MMKNKLHILAYDASAKINGTETTGTYLIEHRKKYFVDNKNNKVYNSSEIHDIKFGERLIDEELL